MAVRGIRGANTCVENTKESINEATKELLLRVVEANQIETTDICSIFFTTTPDLNADFPASAARELGWLKVPLLCAREIDVPSALDRIVRVLIHVNTSKSQEEIKHCYLGHTAKLRPDL